ncbi:hypothetical protein [Xanthomonas campestris]|mgnify:CR=1 FL=1|jgi:hypothetical protein|uniref:hypothetical protein n=1 Tax=Xanthomonas campestris TaxID=339 RepID=UPI0015B4AD85|nr:hypothetical protein [Xanthomonas campestris]MDO0843127.1 hypothetical protein [Xanthomonas campestris pv. campestris]MEA0706932.1 hypothetical protein [Xanthomonas campestris pv. campestris]MEA0719193.1 hypothetical protein [Xanthomonas campestris pv. campestris]MEA0740173.1 hypothetical protein [Xanthomonas campestris pv. campestris]MEA0765101.1 hypothetical protein [Xanthomonas campestris pv. campestris]
MSFLQQHWALIAANPWLFASWILLVAGLTWTVIHFLYRHRLELYRHRGEEDAAEIKRLRDRLSELKEGRAGAANEPSVGIPLPVLSGKYEYSDAGDHGLNILGQTLAELVVNQTYSMAAKVPDNGFLKIQLTGTPPVYLDEPPGGWAYNVSTRNWQGNRYDEHDHTQIFTAKSGEAELAFIPRRRGKITVTVYEGGREPAWEKVLKVINPKS